MQVAISAWRSFSSRAFLSYSSCVIPPSPRFIKKSPKRSIHDLSRDIETDLNQLEEIWEELEKGPHRVAGIMAAASLEHALEYAITQRFSQISRRKPTEFESLFRYPKFLSSFG